jgi:hypothetical protein
MKRDLEAAEIFTARVRATAGHLRRGPWGADATGGPGHGIGAGSSRSMSPSGHVGAIQAGRGR